MKAINSFLLFHVICQERKMSKTPSIISALIFSTTAIVFGGDGIIQSASAADRLNHAASFCRKDGSDGTFDIRYNGNVENDSSSKRLRVICPVIRTDAWDSAKVSLHVIDKSDDKFTCSFYDKTGYGHNWHWHTWKDSVGKGTNNYRTFTWDDNNLIDKNSGTLSIVCYIPTKDSSLGSSHISGYTVDQ